MAAARITTNLLGRRVRLREALKNVPAKGYSEHAKAGDSAEITAITPSPFDTRRLVLLLLWDDGTFLGNVAIEDVIALPTEK